MSDSLTVPAGRHRTEIEIKKSRFICTIDYVADADQAKQIREQLKEEFPGACHHCWATQIGTSNQIIQSCSDDGEPHGTAGKPMLNQLQHGNISFVQAVVSRIYGGIKLGTGGLMRAYSDSVGHTLESLERKTYVAWTPVTFEMSYDLEPVVRQHLTKFELTNEDWSYTDLITLSCQCNENEFDELKESLTNLSGGRITFKGLE